MFDYRELSDEEFIELIDKTQKNLIGELETEPNTTQAMHYLNRLAYMRKQFYDYQGSKV